ncbi:Hypothetical predicted protein [Podarcis lilfordi]|uniref:Uncharacterized protein n=1 Tax=Podarcis lilfordi TaxID=74358 RepID=A0AA35JVH9_9SAUR|nr:Hypothetical predicted protein [Podarcis lilfordi]
MMPVFLKAILAICLLVEIVSTTPLRQPEQIDDIKFKRYVAILNASLDRACKRLNNSSCGNAEIRKIRFEPNTEKICQTYKNVFLDVHCALDKVAKSNPTECNKTVSEIQPHPELFDNQTSCTLPNDDDMLMKEFCLKLQKYVSRLYANCANS